MRAQNFSYKVLRELRKKDIHHIFDIYITVVVINGQL